MSKTYEFAAIVGSLRKDSLNRKMAQAIIAAASPALAGRIVDIDMPLFNQDLEATPPASWVAFREAIRPVDAVLFVTPEYNRSMPAALKNALDVGSRPYGHSVWTSKPAAVISVSPGATGGFGANHHLRQSLVSLDMPTMAQPEAYIGHAGAAFDGEGKIATEALAKLIANFAAAFARWTAVHAGR